MPNGNLHQPDPNMTGRALPLWLLGTAALLLVALLLVQLSGAFRGPDQVTDLPEPAQPVSVAAPQTDSTQQSLQARLQSAIADNRILNPLDDNAIATLIELKTAQPDTPALQTTLLELYPLAVQVVEGSLDRGELDLASAQIALLARTGHASTSLDLLREKLDRELRARDPAAARAEAAATRAETATTPGITSPAPDAAAMRPAPTAAPTRPATPAAPQPVAAAATRPPSAAVEPANEPAAEAASNPGAAGTSPAPQAATAAPAAEPVETPPVQIAFAAPNYPPRARSRRIEGEVELAFTIDRNGEPVDIRVVRAEPPNTFDIEAIRAAQRWRFEPRRVNGQPVDTPMTRTLRFELGG